MRRGKFNRYTAGFHDRPDKGEVVQPEKCQCCDRRALYMAYTTNGTIVGACAEHRGVAAAAMVEVTARHDQRYEAAIEFARKPRPFVERGYNVGKKKSAR